MEKQRHLEIVLSESNKVNSQSAFWEGSVQLYKSLSHLHKYYYSYCTNFIPSLDSENRGRQIKRDKF